MFDFIKNRRRHFYIAVNPAVYKVLKEFADTYNISAKSAIQVTLAQNLDAWAKDIKGLNPTPAAEKKNPNTGRVTLPDGREIMTRS